MASSENLATIVDPWAFRTSFQDPWISDVFSRDTQTLTKALHKSLVAADSDAFTSFLDIIAPESSPTPTVSGISGGAAGGTGGCGGGGGGVSEPETAAPKRHRSSIPPTGGKVSKRKSRASKRNHTTFITADPANFRQMVQQVTGVRFGASQLQISPVLKPEPQRLGGRFVGGLPTLDTSAFLLNQQQNSGSGSEITGPGQLYFGPGLDLPNAGPIGSDFDSFSTFPTLESWKAVL